MLTWLSANLINIALIAGLVLVVGLVVRGMLRDRKAGACSCGGNCVGCGVCGGCDGNGASRKAANAGARRSDRGTSR